ncbi:ABC transporter G family member 20-like [Brevipalpus obovatus]|uniref:ABC transporter G family member 20-like n=1 Tax=Brevipalpus obovatus TaxID=246614 RepID=UPI003D9EE44E
MDSISDQMNEARFIPSVMRDEMKKIHNGIIRKELSSSTPKAVYIRNVDLSYRKFAERATVLSGVNVNVPKGSIYGLLGPSGCGKTTILKCIMGLKLPDTGTIRVFGYEPGTPESGLPGCGVGFMPQEIALQQDLTITETWTYFGRINYMNSSAITERIKEMAEMLELKPCDKLVGNLSGGQKRRVSFGSTIIHRPRLVILDEPTVGVDPILRSRIWQELNHLTSNGITIIITTHYIEEARQADVVGFMRRGTVMLESSPASLLSYFSVDSLELVFLKLCYQQERKSVQYSKLSEIPQAFSPPMIMDRIMGSSELARENFTEDQGKPSLFKWLIQFSAVYKKYMLQLIRQPETLVASFLLPIIILLVFCICIGGTPSGLAIGVVNEEHCDENFLDENDCLSHFFLRSIDTYVFRTENYSDFHLAQDHVQQKKLWAAVKIKRGFTEALRARIAFSETDHLGHPLDINDGLIQVSGDLTDLLISITIQNSLLEVYQKTVSASMPSHPRLGDLPITIPSSVFGTYYKSDYFGVRDFAGPGLMIVIIYCISFALTAFSLLLEKKDRTLNRNFAAGVDRLQIVLGTICTRFVFTSLGSVVLMVLGVTVMDIPCRGSLLAATLLLLLQTISGMSLGLLLASVTPSMFVCCVLANGYLLFTFIMSGVMWSVETMPYYLRWLSALQPTTQAVESLRSILIRGLSIDRPNVLIGFFSSSIWIVIFVTLSVLSLKIQDD